MDHSLLPSVRNATLPEKYQAAKVALMQCDKIDECKSWADKAAALASYAKQSNDKTLEHAAMRIRARAVRRCGELLEQIEKARPGPKRLSIGSDTQLSRKKAAQDAGLSKRQQIDALRVANVPVDSFELQVESDQPPTVTDLAKQGKKPMNGKPLYERLGMTKQEFQAGMYFRGDMEDYVKALERYDMKDVVNGSTPEEREAIKRNIKLIGKLHKALMWTVNAFQKAERWRGVRLRRRAGTKGARPRA